MTDQEQPSARGRQGLRATCLSFPETLSQSVANISPTLTPVIIVPLVFATAAAGTWLAYLFATVGLVFVAANINQFARRSATPGSLYSFVTRGLGVGFGFASGWCLILAYLLTASAVLSGAVSYAGLLLDLAHLRVHPAFLYALGTFIAWVIAYRDIKLSTRVMLVLEVVSMALILVLGVVVIGRHGNVIDPAQFDLSRMSVSGLKAGLILATFSYVGFESATTLGEEARHPHTSIPRSVLLSVLISGAFFTLTAYIAVLGFEESATSLASSTAPFNDLANSAGVAYFGVLISSGAVISLFACTLASINACARIVYSMSRQGTFHARLGTAHESNKTPHLAVTLCAAAVFALPALLLAKGLGALDIFNDLSTVATYGFLIVYALVSIAAPVYLRRIGQLGADGVAWSALALLFILPPIIATVYPTPPPPADRFPYYFLAYLSVGGAWYWLQRSRGRPGVQNSDTASGYVES